MDKNDLTTRTMRAAAMSLCVMAFVVAVFVGCGGGSGAPASSTSTPPTPNVTPPAPAPGAGAPAAAATPAELGAKVFQTRCMLCHGKDGHGDGVASKGLNPKPRNFHDRDYMRTRTDAQLLEVIHKGKGAMPRWEGQLSEAEMTAVLAHIRRLGQTP